MGTILYILTFYYYLFHWAIYDRILKVNIERQIMKKQTHQEKG